MIWGEWAQVLSAHADLESMEISGIASLATRMSQQRTADAADTMVLKKALKVQQQTAQTLIAAVTPAASLPSHLGQNVNTVA